MLNTINVIINYRKLKWDIKYLKIHSQIDVDNNIYFSEKKDLAKKFVSILSCIDKCK